jgi:hypothetical protein
MFITGPRSSAFMGSRGFTTLKKVVTFNYLGL